MKLKYPLQIQFFAANEAGSAGGSAPAQEQPAEQPIDYDKLADIVSKRSQSAEDSALKGYLKEQGLTGNELSEQQNNYVCTADKANVSRQITTT